MKEATPEMPIVLVGCSCHWNIQLGPVRRSLSRPLVVGAFAETGNLGPVLLECADRPDQHVSAAADDVAVDGPLAGKIGVLGKDGRDGGRRGGGNHGCAKAS